MSSSIRLSISPGIMMLAALSTGATTAYPESLNLPATVDKILAYQPRLRTEQEKLREIDAQQRGVLASALPSINASVTWARKEDALSGNSVLFNGESYNAYAGEIEVTAPIYSGGRLSAARRAARKNENLQKISVAKTARDLTIEGILQFHKVLLAQRTLETAERLHAIQKSLLNTAQARYRVGNESRLSVLQIKTQLALLVPQITEARNNLSILASELADLAGLEDLQELSIKGRLGPWNFALPLNQKIEERPEWKTLQVNIDLLDDTRSLVLSAHFPQVAAFGTLTRQGFKFSDLANSDTTAWNAGVRLSIPIFSGLESMHQRAEYRSKRLQMDYLAMNLSKSLELERVRALQGFENARVVEKSSLEAFGEAQEAVKVAQKSYQIGTIGYLQVSETQKALADAERSFARSQFQVLEAFTRCYVANGWEVAELPQKIEAALVIATQKGNNR